MLRYAAAELLDRNMHDLIHHTRPDGSHHPVGECPLLEGMLTGRSVRQDNKMLWRRNGSLFYAEYSSFPFQRADGSAGSVIALLDLSTRRDSRRRHALQHAVSQMLEREKGGPAA